jgi:hypothetical protein
VDAHFSWPAEVALPSPAGSIQENNATEESNESADLIVRGFEAAVPAVEESLIVSIDGNSSANWRCRARK